MSDLDEFPLDECLRGILVRKVERIKVRCHFDLSIHDYCLALAFP